MLIETLSKEERIKAIQKLVLLEKKLEIKIPPLFFRYVTTFKIGLTNGFPCETLYLDKFCRPTRLQSGYSYIENYKRILFFGHLEPLDKYFMNTEIIIEGMQKYDMLRIGDIIRPPGLFIGITEPNRDKVYSIIWEENDGQPLLICDNIFDFISGLKKDKYNENSIDGDFIKQFPQKYYQKVGEIIELNDISKKRIDKAYLEATSENSIKLNINVLLNQISHKQ